MVARVLTVSPVLMSVLLIYLLSACETGGDDAAAARQTGAAAPAQATRTARPAKAGTTSPDMVAAVGSAAGPSPLELRFILKARPEVGEPVDLELELTPRSDFDRLYATFQASDGLEMRSGGEIAQLQRPPRDTPISHTVTLVPRRDGIFSVTAVVLSDTSTQSVARTFSIPLIAGEGIVPLAVTPTQPVNPDGRTVAGLPQGSKPPVP